MKSRHIGVILMTYGSPKTLADVPIYLKHVYGGKDASEENIKEFQRRYHLIGGSPLIRITQQQAAALEKVLNKKSSDLQFTVGAGMRFSEPFIADVISELAKNVDTIVGIIMSPQYSPLIMNGYVRELENAINSLQSPKIKLVIAQDWYRQPLFLQALAERVQEALTTVPEDARDTIPVLFSAHSMPKRVIDKEPEYIDQLKETAKAIARLVGLPNERWQFCYQSAGHTPEEWLKPDFADIMPELAKRGQKHVLIAPVQFLADHLEILYDVDIAARQQAEQYGIAFYRTQSLNTSNLFIGALAAVVERISR